MHGRVAGFLQYAVVECQPAQVPDYVLFVDFHSNMLTY
jgi:hypothetical protein